MKNIYNFIAVFLFGVIQLSFAQDQVQVLQSPNGFSLSQTDVMGNILSINQNTGDAEIYSRTDFLLFPGFPLNQTGSSIEGGIFCNMDADADMEIVFCIGLSIYAYNMDGSMVAGWPISISQQPSGAPAFGDIDGDGEGEIVIGSYSGSTVGYVYAYKKNGSTVTGFPVNSGYVTRSATLADLDNNGSMEIIVSKRSYPTGQVLVYKGDGTMYPGWPKDIGTVPAASAAVGDITGDNIPEIIFEAYSSLYVWDANGNLLSGFPFNLPTDVVTSYSSPVLADLDNDNINEILFGVHELSGAGGGRIYCLNSDGTSLSGWPVYTSYWIYGPPSVGFIDGDNQLDVAVGDQVLSGTPVDKVYAWDKNGILLPGFPVSSLNAINIQIILADIDDDNSTELIFDDNTNVSGSGSYHAVNHDGTAVTGWPLVTMGSTFFHTPCITDINIDGVMDMIGAGTDGFGSSAPTYLYLWNTQDPYTVPEVQVPMFQYNTMHNGVYDDPTIVPVELTSFTADVNNNNNIVLKWTTATEINNRGFEVERKQILPAESINDWEAIGFVNGNGTSTISHSYLYKDNNVAAGKYLYRLKQIDYDGSFEYSYAVEVKTGITELFSLEQNYPNPFNPSTKINFQIAERGLVTLKVYDLLGKEIAVLVNEEMQAGSYSVEFNANSVEGVIPSSVYFYKLTSGNFSATKKLILVK